MISGGAMGRFFKAIRGFGMKAEISPLASKGAGADFPLSPYFGAGILTIVHSSPLSAQGPPNTGYAYSHISYILA